MGGDEEVDALVVLGEGRRGSVDVVEDLHDTLIKISQKFRNKLKTAKTTKRERKEREKRKKHKSGTLCYHPSVISILSSRFTFFLSFSLPALIS